MTTPPQRPLNAEEEAWQAWQTFRDGLGRRVREVWVAYCVEIGDTNPAHLAPWEALSERDKEVDRRIGDELWQMGCVDGSRMAFRVSGVLERRLPADAGTPDDEEDEEDGKGDDGDGNG